MRYCFFSQKKKKWKMVLIKWKSLPQIHVRFNRKQQFRIMSLPFAKVLIPLMPVHLDVLKESNSMNLKHAFQTSPNLSLHETVFVGCTENFLIVLHNQNGMEFNYFCPFEFDLKFQILRRQWHDSKTPGIPYGIRFERGPQNQAFQIYHASPSVVSEWGSFLSKKINQRNFHKLFKAKKKIGKGAFASVYLAERLTDKKMVAVKAFSKQKQFSGEKGKQALKNQIKLTRDINHPNITKLEEVYETQNSIYVILECLNGKQLNEVIKSGRKFTGEEIVSMIKQILSALEDLAKKRIIHRDLKPENIMFKYEEGVQLSICDFGLATYADAESYLFVRCGTPGYVAPEIINIKDMKTKSDSISDVFSAGVILHLLLLGFSPFPGKKYNEVLSQNRSCQFNFEKSEYGSISSVALNLLKMMLEKNPNMRISAQNALKHEFFNSSEMDIEEPEKKFLQEVNFMKIPHKAAQQHLSVHNGSEMEDENSKPNYSGKIGQIVKKKLSFMLNESEVSQKSTTTRQSFKKYY